MAYPGQRNMREAFADATQAEVFDHFTEVNSKARWNTLEGDANSDVTLDTDGRAGVILINADVSLNEEANIYSNPVFKFNGDLPITASGRMVGDAATDNAHAWIFGVSTGFDAVDLIVDGGLTLASSFTGCLFFKPYNTNKISVVTCTTAATVHQTDVTNFTQVASPGSLVPYLHLQIDIVPKSESFFEVVYRVDESGSNGLQQAIAESNNKPIKHVVRFDPSGKMALGAGLKNGKALEASILYIDYMGAVHQAYREQ